MIVTGASFVAKDWIAKHNKPTSHGFRCECDRCQLQMAAQFMDHLLSGAAKDAATIHRLTSAHAESVRAYRATLK